MLKKNKKIIILISFIIALFSGVYFLIFLSHRSLSNPSGQLTASIAPSLANLTIPTEFQFEGQTIPLTWTDDNKNENLIIQSDRKYYDGKDSSEVYFGITNKSDKDQKPDIQFLFDQKESRGVKEMALLNGQNDVIASGKTNFYKAVIYYPQNSKGEFFIEAKGDNGGYGYLDPYYASGLVGYWSFNGSDINNTTNTAYDRSGSSPANNGTMINMATSSRATEGISGQALKFDGVNDYVDTADIDFATGGFTLSAWFKSNTLGSIQRIISKWSAWNNQIELTLREDGDVTASIGSEGEYRADGNWADNNWHFAVMVVDTSNTNLYIDGVYKGQDAHDNSFPTNNKKWQIGALGSDNNEYFNGLIDEVRVYNRALSASEIQDLYRIDSAKAKFNKPQSNFMKDSSLVGYWSFDGSATNWTSAAAGTVTDLSDNNNTGTMTNMSRSNSIIEGISGQALKFDGSNDYIAVPKKSYFTAAPFSFSAWVKLDVLPSALGHTVAIVSFDHNAAAPWKSWYIYVNNADNSLNFETINSELGFGGGAGGGAGERLSSGVWYHIVATLDSSFNANLYINGVQAIYRTTGSSMLDGDSNLKIGSYQESAVFPGIIDEVRIYNRALSAGEIQNLYKAGAAKMTVNSPATYSLTNGLVGNWTFNGQDMNWGNSSAEALDRSGQNPANNGNVTGFGKDSVTEGKVGQALSFDGVDDYVDVNDADSLTPSSAITVSGWIKLEVITSGVGKSFASKWVGTGSQRGWSFASDFTVDYNDEFYLAVSSNGVNSWLVGSTNANLVAGQWVYLTAIYDGSNIYLYKNGSLLTTRVISGSNPGSIYNNNSNLVIGAFSNGSSPTNAKIDEVRVYNRALSASEIQQLYQSGARTVKFKQ